MNTIDRWELTATIQDLERKKFWLEYLETDTVPIRSEKWQLVSVPGHPVARVYMLDLMALSLKQIDSLAAGLAKNFCEDPAVVNALIFQGVPILADDVVIKKAGKVVKA